MLNCMFERWWQGEPWAFMTVEALLRFPKLRKYGITLPQLSAYLRTGGPDTPTIVSVTEHDPQPLIGKPVARMPRSYKNQRRATLEMPTILEPPTPDRGRNSSREGVLNLQNLPPVVDLPNLADDAGSASPAATAVVMARAVAELHKADTDITALPSTGISGIAQPLPSATAGESVLPGTVEATSQQAHLAAAATRDDLDTKLVHRAPSDPDDTSLRRASPAPSQSPPPSSTATSSPQPQQQVELDEADEQALVDALIASVDATNQEQPDLASHLEALVAEVSEASASADTADLHSRCVSLLERLPPQLTMSELLFVDLFSGCGGRVLGYVHDSDQWDGVAVEADSDCCRVHAANLPSVSVLQHRIDPGAPLPSNLPVSVQSGTVAVCSMGPPCQPFSTAGNQLGAGDARDAFPAALEAVRQLRPLLVEIETVLNLRKFPEVFDTITEDLRAMGYCVRVHRIDFSRYGVPQRRVRLLIFGSAVLR